MKHKVILSLIVILLGTNTMIGADHQEESVQDVQTEEIVLESQLKMSEEKMSEEEAEDINSLETDHEEAVENNLETVVNIPMDYELSENEIYVSTYSQLKAYIENIDTHPFNTFYFTNDIVATGGSIQVPEAYSFTIVGTNPQTNIRHKFTEATTTSRNDTIQYNHTQPITMTLKDIDISGKNPFGTISTSNASKDTVIIYDNIFYEGPQITHNVGGTAIYRNSNINITKNGSSSLPQEVGEVKHIVFEGNVDIKHLDSSDVTFTMGDNNSFTFKLGSLVNIETKRGMSEKTSNTNVLFEDNAILNIKQKELSGPSSVFYLYGTGSELNMRQGSEMNVDRMEMQESEESIIYSGNEGNVVLDGSIVSFKLKGNQSKYPLINSKSFVMNSGTKFKVDIGGTVYVRIVDAVQFKGFENNEVDINIGGPLSSDGTDNSVFFQAEMGPQVIKNSTINFHVKTFSRNLLKGTDLVIEDSTINLKADDNILYDMFAFNQISAVRRSNVSVEYGTMMPPNALFYNKNGLLEIEDTNIHVKGKALRRKLFEADTLSINNTVPSEINVELSETMTQSLFTAKKLLPIHKAHINVTAVGEVSYLPTLQTEKNTDLILNDSKIKVKSSASKIEVFSGDKVTLNNSSIDVETNSIGGTQLTAKMINLNNSQLRVKSPVAPTSNIVSTGGLGLVDSNVLIEAKSGSLGTVLMVNEGEVLVDAGSRMALAAPTSKSLIQTSTKPITITFQAEQINQWSAANIVSSYEGLNLKPKFRYESDAGFGTLKITYLNNMNTKETITYLTQEFTGENNVSLESAFSLLNKNTKVLSVGTLDFIEPEIIAGSHTVNGTTYPNAHIGMTYRSEGIPLSTKVLADASGSYVLETQAIGFDPVTIDAYSDYFYKLNVEKTPVESGSLRFGNMPITLPFGTQMIPKKQTTFNRSDVMELEIIDDRSGGLGWKLEVEVTSDIYDSNGIRPNLSGSLLFADERGTVALTKNQRYTVATSDGETSVSEVLEYATNKGLLLRIDDGSGIFIDANYAVNLKWILSDNR